MHVPTRAPSHIGDACPQDTLFSPGVGLVRAPSHKTRHLCNVFFFELNTASHSISLQAHVCMFIQSYAFLNTNM